MSGIHIKVAEKIKNIKKNCTSAKELERIQHNVIDVPKKFNKFKIYYV